MASEIGEAPHHGRRRAGLLAEGVELPPGQGDGAGTLLAGRGRRARADGLLARSLHRVDGPTATARRRPRRRDDGTKNYSKTNIRLTGIDKGSKRKEIQNDNHVSFLVYSPIIS